nr:hypothetical protein [Hyphomonas sp. Mor2]
MPLILLMGLPWQDAAAAPWTLEKGSLYARASLASERVEGLDAIRGDLYAEYGLRDGLTASAKIEHVAYPDAGDFNADGWRVTLRQRVIALGAFNVSVEAGLLEGAAIGGMNGCDTLGFEARLGAAWSGAWRERRTFAFAETARRDHEDCQRDRYEFGLGQQLTENVWTISQAWFERGSTNAESDKFQSELLWRGDRLDYSIGYRNENGGFFVEESIFIAVAKRF